MTSFSAWLSVGAWSVGFSVSADSAWRIVERSPSSVTVIRGGSALAPQTVRIEYLGAGRRMINTTEIARVSTLGVFILGVRNHDTQADTDLQEGDQFALNGRVFVIDHIQYRGDQLHAYGVAQS